MATQSASILAHSISYPWLRNGPIGTNGSHANQTNPNCPIDMKKLRPSPVARLDNACYHDAMAVFVRYDVAVSLTVGQWNDAVWHLDLPAYKLSSKAYWCCSSDGI